MRQGRNRTRQGQLPVPLPPTPVLASWHHIQWISRKTCNKIWQDKETRQDKTRQDKETRQDRARQDQLPVPLPPTGVPSQLALYSHWISRKTYDQNDKTRKQDKMRQDRYKTIARPVTCATTSNRGSSQLVLHSWWISRIRKTYITKNNQTRKQDETKQDLLPAPLSPAGVPASWRYIHSGCPGRWELWQWLHQLPSHATGSVLQKPITCHCRQSGLGDDTTTGYACSVAVAG